jgi:hypothetical protein
LIAANGTNAPPGDLGDTLFEGEGKDELRVEGASSYILTNTTLNIGNILIHQLPVASNKAEGVIESIRLDVDTPLPEGEGSVNFVQQNFPNTGTGTNSSSVLDTGIFLGAPSAGDLIAIVEDISITATTPGVEIFG